MRPRYTTLPIMLILLLFCATCPVAPAKEPPPVAQCPTWRVGDWWEFTDGTREEVIGVTDKGYLVKVTQDGRKAGEAFYTLDLRLVKSPYHMFRWPMQGHRALAFPLAVGKKWEINGQGQDQDDFIWKARFEYRVERYTRMWTFAGRLDVYALSMYNYMKESGFDGTMVYYYSPRAKRVIAVDESNSMPGNETWSISKFKVAP